LRSEVDTLLDQQSGSLLDGRAWEQAPNLLHRPVLDPGAELGPYRVTDAIGSGGMGEVYKARDRRLGRDVAIKVLPEHLARDAQARARFQREAKAVATLNHPHICSLYDVGPDYLVMELVEGSTLTERMAKGAILLENRSKSRGRSPKPWRRHTRKGSCIVT
jgi:serine/threonine protein kinase